jgi:hypothetical protein
LLVERISLTDCLYAKTVPQLTMERMYNSYSFMTSALDGGEWSASLPIRALYPQGKDPWYPLDRRLGLRADLDTEARENIFLPLLGIEP